MLKILVPTDFSPNALAAFCYAVPFAAQFNADLVVAHVIKPPKLPADTSLEEYERVMEEEKQQAREEMQKQLARKKEALPAEHDVRVVPVIISNTFVKGMNQLVAQENLGLIIMGTRGASGLKRLFVGSNTADIVGQAVVPLLAIPEKAQFTGLNNIVVALNIAEWKATESLHLLRNIVRTYASSVTILKVGGEEREVRKEEVEAKIEEALAISPNWVEVKSRDLAQSIQDFVDATPTDLLVLTPQPKSLWQQLFSTSVTHDLVFSPEIPVLFIPHSSRDIFSA